MTDIINPNDADKGMAPFVMNPKITARLTPEQQEACDRTVGKVLDENLGDFKISFLTIRNSKFAVRSQGGGIVPLRDDSGRQYDELFSIVLNVTPYYHCTWYVEDWDPRQTSFKKPDAIWRYGETPDPALVPAYVTTTKKVNKENGVKTNYYSIKQRLILCLVKLSKSGGIEPPDLGRLFVLDVPSTGIFRKPQDKGLMNFVQYKDLLKEHGCLPCNVITSISFDPASTVPSPVFQIMLTKERQPYFLAPAELQKAVYKASFEDEDVLKNLDVAPKSPVREGEKEAAPEEGAAPPKEEPVAAKEASPPKEEAASEAPKEEAASAPKEEVAPPEQKLDAAAQAEAALAAVRAKKERTEAPKAAEPEAPKAEPESEPEESGGLMLSGGAGPELTGEVVKELDNLIKQSPVKPRSSK
ncbi:MAG: hypothetical protein LBQ12_08515 [Deltaproteobacteria bacterium]|jgi:hypothetical protein|nr:hypothetical protein [Deltaproteobacteria bacterium]